jgi:hypothetical protein
MATATQNEVMPDEPLVRTIVREVPNLRNSTVVEEYRHQRAIINAAAGNQRDEMEFWEGMQTHEGWV